MVSIAAGVLLGATTWLASYVSSQEKDDYGASHGSDDVKLYRHLRQDLRLIVFLLGAIVMMLGIVADVVLLH